MVKGAVSIQILANGIYLFLHHNVKYYIVFLYEEIVGYVLVFFVFFCLFRRVAINR